MQVHLFFHQGKQQHTLVLGQSLNSSCDLCKGQGQVDIPPNHKMHILCIF